MPKDTESEGGAGSPYINDPSSTKASDDGQTEKEPSPETTQDNVEPESLPASLPTVTAGADEDSEGGDNASDAAKPRRKKLSSKKRKSLRRAREQEAARSANATEQPVEPKSAPLDKAEDSNMTKSVNAPVAMVVNEPAGTGIDGDTVPSDDTAQPRRKKLSSKQRRSQRKEREAALQLLLQLDPHEQQKKPQDVVPASAPQKKAASASAPSGNKGATTAAPAKPSAPAPAPGLSASAHAALRGVLTALHQTLQAEGQLACVNSGATKASVLREVTKLGYTCVEGRPSQFQYVQWNQTHNSFEVSHALRDQPDKFPQTSKSKGDIKLLDPALFIRCRCIPAFGAESPEQMGLQVFRSTFLQFVEEVAMGESDAFVFAAAVSEYVDFVQQALPALPLARAALGPPSTSALPYASKRNGACTLQCTVSTAEAANNEIYYAVLITA
jgi:hypothetical protein